MADPRTKSVSWFALGAGVVFGLCSVFASDPQTCFAVFGAIF